ncbi:MAG: radical SAM protein, partial [Euryarchaeota archaeon]|nr:radical SAM protein [Euryarchaeota archaeon]
DHVDEPQTLIEASLFAQKRLISGYKGYAKTNVEKLREAEEPNQVAISLSGEPTLYPYLDELIALYRRHQMTTFVVSNGSVPAMLERIRPTQVYLSLNSPDEARYYSVCKPRSHRFEQLLESLRVLAGHPARTAIRVTLARELNAIEPASYARLIEQAEPDYVEIKSYMHLGYSRRRLPRTAMLSYDEIEMFARQIAEHLGYVIAGSSQASRVVILSKNGSVKKIAR